MEQKNKKVKSKKDKKFIASIIVFVIGFITLAVGATFLVLNILKKPDVEDAKFLVEVGSWVSTKNENVVWNFSEIGNGTLTVDGSEEYDFIWALEGDKLKIETSWASKTKDEFTYKIDQDKKILTVSENGENLEFVPNQTSEEE